MFYKKKYFHAFIAVFVACVFWAASFIASKAALNASTPPLLLVCLRLLVSSFCFLVWFMVSREKFPLKNILRDIRTFFWLSLFGAGLHYSVQTVGISYTTASNASLYSVTGPVAIALLGFVFLKEKLSLKKVAGILTALAGVLVVMGTETILNFDLSGYLMGDFMVFVSIFMWGIFTVMGKSITSEYSPAVLSGTVTFISSLYMIPAGIADVELRGFNISDIGSEAWFSILFLGIFCSFLATLLYVFALNRSEAQKVGVYLYTIPPMSYFFAALFLDEQITLNLIAGTLIVICGVVLTEKSS